MARGVQPRLIAQDLLEMAYGRTFVFNLNSPRTAKAALTCLIEEDQTSFLMSPFPFLIAVEQMGCTETVSRLDRSSNERYRLPLLRGRNSGFGLGS